MLFCGVRGECPSADLTGDCIVDFKDLAILASQWLTTDPCIPDGFVYIPAGTFQMGDSFNEGEPDELPVHTVQLDSFYIGKYEVTNAQYCQYLNSALRQGLITVTSGVVYKAGSGTSYPYCYTSPSSPYSQISYIGGVFSVRTKSGRNMSDDPMVVVTWFGAVAYCNWLSQEEGKDICYNTSDLNWPCDFNKKGYRLPTESEWEYAARGGLSGKRFPWGDTISQTQANFQSSTFCAYDVSPVKNIYHPLWSDVTYPYTSPVVFFDGTMKYKTDYNWPGSATSYQTTSGLNNYGLYDIAGNVWEWCNDWYSETYYSSSPPDNPTGPTSGDSRVLHGGVWYDNAYHCRVSNRSSGAPSGCGNGLGFRCVLDTN